MENTECTLLITTYGETIIELEVNVLNFPTYKEGLDAMCEIYHEAIRQLENNDDIDIDDIDHYLDIDNDEAFIDEVLQIQILKSANKEDDVNEDLRS